ncbi:MAG TPA: NIPSNAP family protein [Chloroflexota bacterium]|nr:NIPSNAP family protein [Chloroflexota bacterium]
MIYEMRTYDLRSGMVPEFEQRYGAALPRRAAISPLGAFWHTEIGPLNQVIAVWPYDNIAERERARGEAATAGIWPPPVQDLIVREEAWILHPAPFMRPLQPGKLGNVYEMRVYTAQAGKVSEVIRLWSEAIADREKLSPLAAGWYSDLGALSTWIHVWPYQDLNERARIRAESQKLGTWPPPTRPFLTRQENKILIPAEFSPLQ